MQMSRDQDKDKDKEQDKDTDRERDQDKDQDKDKDQDQDFIMLIMNCKKYAAKARFQKKTWLKTIPSRLKYYHVIGDESLATEFSFDEQSRVLWVKTPDDYNSLPNKVIAAYAAVNATYKFKYLLKTDDDQILVNDKFLDMIMNLVIVKQPKTHYGGYIVDVPKPYLSQYHRIHPELPKNLPVHATRYCSGRFYFLSCEAIAHLLTKRDAIKKEYLEDYAIGLNLPWIYKDKMLNIKTNDYFTDIELSDFPKLIQNNQI